MAINFRQGLHRMIECQARPATELPPGKWFATDVALGWDLEIDQELGR
jgi:hypothetical protein